MNIVRCWVAASIFLGPAVVTFAQTPAPPPRPVIIVAGTVHDSAGDPLPDVSVVFEEKATAESIEAKTDAKGTFSFLTFRAGAYNVRAEKGGMRTAASLALTLGEKKQIDLVLGPANQRPAQSPGASKSSGASTPNPSPPKMEYADQPSFTVAGVTDWTNVGGHGSDTKLRTSESLARETLALKSGDGSDALANATEAARTADSHRLLGDRAETSGDPVTAEREYEEAVRLNPSEQNYFAWGAELLLHRAIQPAREVFSKGATAHPKSARMLAGLGAALYAGGSYDQAARRLCAAADLQRDAPTGYLFLGKMEKASPDALPCAEDRLEQFARNQPDSALANYYYAVALWKQYRGVESGSEDSSVLQRIEALLQKAIAVDPKFDEAYVQLGTLYYARGNFPQAISAYKKAIEVNPQSAEAHYRLGSAYKRIGEEQKSEQEMQLYKQADKTETAAVEQQRREIRQFMIILKDQPKAEKPEK
jgi:tetratricopeptide (TPR) repeat protein